MMTSKVVHFAAVLALSTAVAACKDLKPTKGSGSGLTTAGAADGPKVKVEFYVMSKCPFGSEVEKGIKPVLEQIGNRVDFQLDFISDEPSPGQFNSMHGEPETKGNIVQLCAMRHYPESAKYMSFIDCQNRTFQQIPDNWEACAKEVGLDAGKIRSCYEGSEGKQLLSASIKRTKARGATGSPTMYVAGQPYQGGRTQNDFMRAICQNMPAPKAEACAKIPEPVQVDAVVLTDKRCTKCAHQGIEQTLRGRFFPKLNVRVVDYSSDEGKQLYKELSIKYLPVWLFEQNATKAEQWAQIQRWMQPRGNRFQLQVAATFDPTAEICDNKIDDTGNGKIDCDDPTCKEELVCREEKKQQVDVFVMSQCPYGVKALDAMKEVLPNFGNKLKFDVHYIADEQAGSETGFNALHGQPEVRENIRQLCAKKYYSKNNKYLDYIWCRNQNYRSEDWEGCATGGISAAVIRKCSNGPEGKKLLGDDIKIAKALQISGSPTWLANNRFKFSGIAADAIKTNICQHNPGMQNCDKQLTQKAEVQGSCN